MSLQAKILLVRGQQVMLDQDLADLYGVDTGALTRSVRRNVERFPADFMFQLDKEEWAALRCQIGISNEGRGGRRYAPLESQLVAIFKVLRQLMAPPPRSKHPVGFRLPAGEE